MDALRLAVVQLERDVAVTDDAARAEVLAVRPARGEKRNDDPASGATNATAARIASKSSLSAGKLPAHARADDGAVHDE